MPITTISSREFNQDRARVKKAAMKGPVFITDRGRAAFVLLNIADYNKSVHKEKSLLDLLSCPAAAEIEFDPPRLEFIPRPVDFD